MNEQNTLCGHPVVAVLKPGDIVVVEVNRQVHAQQWVTLKQFLSDSAERLGIKILVLPPEMKVARVMPDGVRAYDSMICGQHDACRGKGPEHCPDPSCLRSQPTGE